MAKDALMFSTNKSLLEEIYYVSFGPLSNGKISIPLISTVSNSLPQELAVSLAEQEFFKFTESFHQLRKLISKRFNYPFNERIDYFGDFILYYLSLSGSCECEDLRLMLDDLRSKIAILKRGEISHIQSYTSVNDVQAILEKYLIDNNVN